MLPCHDLVKFFLLYTHTLEFTQTNSSEVISNSAKTNPLFLPSLMDSTIELLNMSKVKRTCVFDFFTSLNSRNFVEGLYIFWQSKYSKHMLETHAYLEILIINQLNVKYKKLCLKCSKCEWKISDLLSILKTWKSYYNQGIQARKYSNCNLFVLPKAAYIIGWFHFSQIEL